MKRILITLAFLLPALCVLAQDIPAGIRMEVAEIEENENEYSIFSYKDDDGTFGYYLSIGFETPILAIIRDDDDGPSSSLSHLDETCIWMGATREETFATLDKLLVFLEQEPGTTMEVSCRESLGAEKLGGSSRALCMVSKRILQSKRLSFLFQSGGGSATADLTKSAIKTLRLSLELDKKLHPDTK